MICEQCGGEMEKGKPWEFKGKTFNREVCSQCGDKAKAFLVKGGDEKPKKDMDEVWSKKDLRMARMCGIKAATEFSKVNNEVNTPQKVILTAETFVEYIYKGVK